MTGAEAEDDIPLGERKTVTDFCYLLDKSKQLFNGLRYVQRPEPPAPTHRGHNGLVKVQTSASRELSRNVNEPQRKVDRIQPDPAASSRIQLHPVGSSRIQPHPAASSRIQPDPVGSSRIQSDPAGSSRIQSLPQVTGCLFVDRQVLDSRYGLKRWQIGEVASKIGQLYYHYYLRTSETSYLNEAFSFYSAIRQRSYYYQVNKEDRPELVVKKLRYYARYIVVCLLLNKMDLVKVLVKELSEEIEDYTQRFNTEDQLEWNLVLQEVAAFIEADPAVVLNDNNSVLVTSNRLQDGSVPPLEQGMVVGQLVLADALIVGNCNNQVKFSELTVDMFRMLQALEREPVNLATQTSKQATLVGFWCLQTKRPFIPTRKVRTGDLCWFCLGPFTPAGPYDFGGVLTNTNRDVVNGETVQKRNQAQKEMHCLHPGDLFPFTRKPLFVIVDSSNSTAYKNFSNLFGQPLVCLLSPTVYPKSVQDQSQRGSLFTLFLYSPLLGFSSVCGLSSVRRGLWERAQDFLRKVFRDIGQMLTRSRSIDQAFLQFFGDEFLRLLLIRFVFCSAALRLHKLFRESRSFPESYPELPKQDTVESGLLQKQVLELAAMLDVQSLFWDDSLESY
ncbi:protein SCAI [Poecilia reticulata]|uniref:protein SCAI n=1 Tax=Poecilia reticulata TaxID=8081 RepID=UPI0007EB72DE|nr:PREDICTED: protein SCAI [Poecilia reticulata]